MKVTPIEKLITIQVASVETTGVSLELTKEEALYLFYLLGAITPCDAFKYIEKSIDNYYPDNSYQLANMGGRGISDLLITPIYEGIKKTLNIEMD
jgi:hypothetical protein